MCGLLRSSGIACVLSLMVCSVYADHPPHQLAEGKSSSPTVDNSPGTDQSDSSHDAAGTQQGANQGDVKKEKKKDNKDAPPEPSVTQHRVTIAGQEIAYTATAREMVLKSDNGDKKARIFFVAYTKDHVEAADRPITFCFNGGPGSSSVWLHLGMLGPKRLVVPDDATHVRPPRRVMENPHSLLDITDLVFIDPVSTGYSRPEKDVKRSQFHGYDQDLNSVAQFLHDYTTEYGRWSSPKFLLGESYGGLRAAGLSGVLQQRYHMYLNGIVLVSAVVDFETISFGGAKNLPYALFVPSYAATAWYHHALEPSLQQLPLDQVVRQAEKFVHETYLPALLQGKALPDDQRKRIAAELARLTGLSPEYVERANLRISMQRFAKELLRDRKRTVGRFDGRYLGIDPDAAGEQPSYDPSGAALMGPFTSAMNDYLYRDLKYESERVYEILTNVWPWDYSRFTNRYVDASETLRGAMTQNPFLKVFAACGYYDLATPQFAMVYTRDQLGLDESLAQNFTLKYYEGGHMMYVYGPSLEKLRGDLLQFYASALDQEPSTEQ